jgi:hypothetical protein
LEREEEGGCKEEREGTEKAGGGAFLRFDGAEVARMWMRERHGILLCWGSRSIEDQRFICHGVVFFDGTEGKDSGFVKICKHEVALRRPCKRWRRSATYRKAIEGGMVEESVVFGLQKERKRAWQEAKKIRE